MKAVAGALICAAVLLAADAQAQTSQDTRWSSWLGCWELVANDAGDGAAESAPRTCVTPLGDNGVTITTTVPDQEPATQTLIPDGVARPIADEECKGTEQTEWSSNGQRLFARAEVTCADGAPRFVSGLALITPDGMWVDIRSFRINGQTTTRVSRYRPAASGPVRATSGHRSLSIAEIKEASGKVPAAVLEAALADTRPDLPVNRRTLLELADANVPGSVIDLMVALAYPDQFVIERPSRIAAGAPPLGFGGPGGVDPLYPFGIDDYYYSGFYYPAYYYSPFGYSYLGRYDPFLFGAYGYAPIGVPAREDGPPASGTGRVISGEGYTRVRPADGDGSDTRMRPGQGASGEGSGGRSAVTRSTGGDAPASAPPPSDSGSSSGSSGGGSSGSPQGFSGGDGGGGRTAQPR